MKFVACLLLIFLTFSIIAQANQPKLHPVEAACITYEMSGQMMNGTITRCHREHAYEQYEIQNITIGITGFTQTQNTHTITIGDTIYVIDLENNTGTQTANPMYQSLVSSMQGQDSENLSDAFMSVMGYAPTSETKTIADHECEIYNSAQLGTVCLTDEGLMLEQLVMGNTTTAVSVSLGDGGDDTNYTLYQNVTITQGPDLSNMPNLQDLMNQSQ